MVKFYLRKLFAVTIVITLSFISMPGLAQDNSISSLITNVNKLLENKKDNSSEINKENLKNAPYFTGKNFNKLKWKGSVMFSDVELDSIYSALQDYDPEGVALAASTPIRSNNAIIPESTTNAPAAANTSFSLQSIIYFSPTDWSIWMNGKKVRKGENFFPNLNVMEVTRDSATFIFSLEDLDKAYPNWQSNMIPVKGNKVETSMGNVYKWSYQSRDGKVFVNSGGVIKFTLAMNQSMSISSMAVSEGGGQAKTMFAGGNSTDGRFSDPSVENGNSSGTEFESLVDEIFQSANP